MLCYYLYNGACFWIAELFDNYMQQDAHEFLNYLLNTIGDLLQSEYLSTTTQTLSKKTGRFCLTLQA